MKLWLTADTHFEHTNIIKYCSRPFLDVQHMNSVLVERWNSKVSPEDWVIHCGDVAMGRAEHAKYSISALLGHKILLRGNHDSSKHVKMYRILGWHVRAELSVNDILFRHYPIDENVECDHKLVVHGHSHGSVVKEGHVDVGVDVKKTYEPILATDVLCKNDVWCILMVLRGLYET